MDFIFLSAIFLASGLAAMWYYRTVPEAGELRHLLPNKVSATSVIMALFIGGFGVYLLLYYQGFSRIAQALVFVFTLLTFESLLLLLLRWIKRVPIAVVLSGLVAVGVFWLYMVNPNFFLQNAIIVVMTLGAATLLIRLSFLRTWYLFLITFLWVVYDFLFVNYILPRYTVPVSTPEPTLLYPAVTAGQVSLGSGDFMFFILFTLIMARDFGFKPAAIVVGIETVALLITGLVLPESGFSVPYLAVMAPIFIIIYVSFLIHKRRSAVKASV